MGGRSSFSSRTTKELHGPAVEYSECSFAVVVFVLVHHQVVVVHVDVSKLNPVRVGLAGRVQPRQQALHAGRRRRDDPGRSGSFRRRRHDHASGLP